jgi:hypothetical protein
VTVTTYSPGRTLLGDRALDQRLSGQRRRRAGQDRAVLALDRADDLAGAGDVGAHPPAPERSDQKHCQKPIPCTHRLAPFR